MLKQHLLDHYQKRQHEVSTLPHNLIKEKLTEQTFSRECSLYLACNEKRTLFFLLLNNLKDLNCGLVRKFVLTFCLLLLPLWESVIVLCFVVHCFVSVLVLQSS